jgi:glutamine amidotransferase
VLSTSYYGTDVVASIKKDNITAVQFHPEKSHNNGLNFLSNWCDGIC